MPKTSSRDPGLLAAIAAAGGISELARSLGLTQPTVSVWKRVPAHHVIRVESLTGLNRRLLRPDLYEYPEPPLSLGGSALPPTRDARRASMRS